MAAHQPADPERVVRYGAPHPTSGHGATAEIGDDPW